MKFCNSTFVKTAAIPRYRTDPSFMQSVWIEISVGSTFKEARHYGSGMVLVGRDCTRCSKTELCCQDSAGFCKLWCIGMASGLDMIMTSHNSDY